MPQVYRWTLIKVAKSTERKRWFYVRDDWLIDESFFLPYMPLLEDIPNERERTLGGLVMWKLYISSTRNLKGILT